MAAFLATAARQAGWDVLCLEGKKPPPAWKIKDAVYYGGTDLAHEVSQRLRLVLLEPPLDWLARLPRKYLMRQVCYATVAEARKLATAAFVKPADAANKCFDAGVYPGGWAIPERRGFPESTPVLIAGPVTWEVEYRCLLLEGEVTTCSPYVRFGRWVKAGDFQWTAPMVELEQVLAFCRAFEGDKSIRLPPAITLDVGRIQGGGWAVVEANPIWSSGLYGCDPVRMLPVLRRASVSRKRLREKDHEWVLIR